MAGHGFDYDHAPPLVRHHNDVSRSMQAALMGILAPAGFQVEEPDRHALDSPGS